MAAAAEATGGVEAGETEREGGRRWLVRNGNLRVLPLGVPVKECHRVAWSPDGRVLAAAGVPMQRVFVDEGEQKSESLPSRVRVWSSDVEEASASAAAASASLDAGAGASVSRRALEGQTGGLILADGECGTQPVHKLAVTALEGRPGEYAVLVACEDNRVYVHEVALSDATPAADGAAADVDVDGDDDEAEVYAPPQAERPALAKATRRFKLHRDDVNCVAVTYCADTAEPGPDGTAPYSTDRRLVLTGSDDRSAIVWDLETLEKLHQFADAHTSFVMDCAISRDNRTCVLVALDRAITVHSMESFESLRQIAGHEAGVYYMQLAPALGTGWGASVDSEGSVWAWNYVTGQKEKLGSLKGSDRGLLHSPDGTRLLGFASRGLKLWDLGGPERKEKTKLLSDRSQVQVGKLAVAAVALHPSGHLAAVVQSGGSRDGHSNKVSDAGQVALCDSSFLGGNQSARRVKAARG